MPKPDGSPPRSRPFLGPARSADGTRQCPHAYLALAPLTARRDAIYRGRQLVNSIVVIEAASARRADRVGIIQTGAGRACGRVTEKPDGTGELSSMSAWPFNGRTGSLLLHQVCRTADRLEVPAVRLTAATSALAVCYYGPAGFTDVGRTQLGLPRMERPLARGPGGRMTYVNRGNVAGRARRHRRG